MISLSRYKEPQAYLADYLPWAGFIAPGVILQKDGLLQKTIAFRGPDQSVSSPSELMATRAQLNNALKRLGRGWSVFFEAQRFQTTHYPDSPWLHPAAWLMDVERHAFYHQGSHFASAYYATLCWQMPPDSSKKLQGLFFTGGTQEPTRRIADDIDFFLATTRELVDLMSTVFIEVTELDDKETLTYLHSTVSTDRHPVTPPNVPMFIDALLAEQPFQVGHVPMLGPYFMPAVTILNVPMTTTPALLDDLNHLGLEYRWVTRYLALDKEQAQREMERYRKSWFQKRKSLFTLFKETVSGQDSALLNSSAAQKAVDADAALQELGQDLCAYGHLTASVVVWDTTEAKALEKAAWVKKTIQSRGFVVRDETFNGLDAWLGTLPGHVYANVRRPMVSTLTLIDMLPVSSVWSGEPTNRHLHTISGVADAHMVCSTAGSTPFHLNLNLEDVGHTLVFGPTGGGKSTLLAALALQWLRYPRAQVVMFDKDKSARASTLAVGGTYYEPGRQSHALRFQPLRDIDDPQELRWACGFISHLLEVQHLDITPERATLIHEALLGVSKEKDPSFFTLSTLCDALSTYDTHLGRALRRYTTDGEWGYLFDGSEDTLELSSFWTLFEMGHMMTLGEAAILPLFDYLFHRVDRLLDGRPTLMLLDEAWLFLKHPTFARQIQTWLKTLRKKNVFCVFATQEVADAIDSPILSTLLSACPTKIYLPDEEALSPAMAACYEKMGLSEQERAVLAACRKKRDYYYRSVRGHRVFSLDLGPVALAFCGASDPASQRFMDTLSPSGDPIDTAQALLRRQTLDWAADLLESVRPLPHLTTQMRLDDATTEAP